MPGPRLPPGGSMIPGMRGMNPRQMKQMMKRLGIEQEELAGVEEVIIRTNSTEYVVRNASVQMIVAQGQKTFQVAGDVEERDRGEGSGAPAGPSIPEEDIMLVAGQANVSPEQARKALEECDGQPAEAILKLMGG